MTENFPIEMMDASAMLSHPQNFRKHPQAQITQIKKSLDEFGWLAPVVWNRRTGYILNGHARVEIAAKRGEKIPVRVVDVGPKVERRILIALDKTGEGVKIDEEMLASLLKEVTEVDENLPPGWTETEIGKLLADLEPEAEEPELENDFSGVPAPDTNLSHIRMVPIYLTTETEPEFKRWCAELAEWYKVETLTDVVYKAVNAAWATSQVEEGEE